MERGFDIWANPSSPHAEGRKAREALEGARARISMALGWDGELVFTSGASEAATLALAGARTGPQFVSAVEHDAVLKAAPGAGVLSVGPGGAVRLTCTESGLVAVQQVNSETGNRQDIAGIAASVHDRGGLLVTDCAQGAGKMAFPSEADMGIVSAHKFGGPIGIGALLVKDFAMLVPAGGQERGYRRGTENLPGALGMAAALEAASDPYIEAHVLEPLDAFAEEVRALGGDWLSDRLSSPTPYIRAIAMPRLSGSAQLMRFDLAGIAVSQGSACSSGTMKRSHVLSAMGLPDELADRTIRVSFGWSTTRAEVERFCETWLEMARNAVGKAA